MEENEFFKPLFFHNIIRYYRRKEYKVMDGNIDVYKLFSIEEKDLKIMKHHTGGFYEMLEYLNTVTGRIFYVWETGECEYSDEFKNIVSNLKGGSIEDKFKEWSLSYGN